MTAIDTQGRLVFVYTGRPYLIIGAATQHPGGRPQETGVVWRMREIRGRCINCKNSKT